jgi:hypothetical protein
MAYSIIIDPKVNNLYVEPLHSNVAHESYCGDFALEG